MAHGNGERQKFYTYQSLPPIVSQCNIKHLIEMHLQTVIPFTSYMCCPRLHNSDIYGRHSVQYKINSDNFSSKCMSCSVTNVDTGLYHSNVLLPVEFMINKNSLKVTNIYSSNTLIVILLYFNAIYSQKTSQGLLFTWCSLVMFHVATLANVINYIYRVHLHMRQMFVSKTSRGL